MHGLLVLAGQTAQRFHGSHADYVGVGLAAVAGWIGVPGLGEAALIAAGIAAAHGRLDISGTIAVAWLGATIGGTTGWAIGLKGGRPLMSSPGPLFSIRRRMLRSGDRLYARHGPLAVYFAPSWLAGINGMRPARFLPVNVAAGLVWALAIGFGAYLAGPSIAEVVSDVGLVGIGILVLLVVIAGTFRARSR